MNIFVTAISTDSGKTLVSAVLCKALNATYHKPVQSGQPTDRGTIAQLLGTDWPTLPEVVALDMPASPHIAAARQGVSISADMVPKPQLAGHVVIEGAGGLLVPLNATETMADVAARVADGIVVVSNYYLGSINHTLLTIEAAQRRNLPLIGLVFNGDPMPGTEEIITEKTGLPVILRVPRLPELSLEAIDQLARQVQWPAAWAAKGLSLG